MDFFVVLIVTKKS